MTFTRIVLASFPLPLALALTTACGGVTLDGGLYNPEPDDAGAPMEPGSGSGSGSATRQGPTPEGPTPGPDAGSAPEDAATSGSCLSSSDCATGEVCAWPTDEDICIAFNPAGVCVRPIMSGCVGVEEAVGCGCNGQDVTWKTGCVGLPGGYAPVGLAHAGSCEDASLPPITVDAGEAVDGEIPVTLDASTNPCDPTVDGVCPQGQQCGYPIGACGTEAWCVPAEEWGFCDSIEPACTCAGTTIAIPGCAEAASVPVAHVGECPSSDGGF